MQDAPEAPARQGAPWGRTAAIGCFMVPLGFFSGGMIAVFVSKVIAYVTRAPACDGVPSCNWAEFMLVGAIIGATTLPALVMWALRSPKRPKQ
ncbi:MAG TPA: hypothetical protein VGJ96_13900 [Gemmatimonadaceae bacterium]|jgi:hypothetical protein